MSNTTTTIIMSAVFGTILIFYLIASTFNDASDEIQGIQEVTNVTGTPTTVKGAGFVKILPLFLAFGVVFIIYKAWSNR